jgi:hypothetical protein
MDTILRGLEDVYGLTGLRIVGVLLFLLALSLFVVLVTGILRKIWHRQYVGVIFLWVGILLIVPMCLLPPWVEVYSLPNANIKAYRPLHYAPLWRPPEVEVRYRGVFIDFERLSLQICVVVLIVAGILYTCRMRKPN